MELCGDHQYFEEDENNESWLIDSFENPTSAQRREKEKISLKDLFLLSAYSIPFVPVDFKVVSFIDNPFVLSANLLFDCKKKSTKNDFPAPVSTPNWYHCLDASSTHQFSSHQEFVRANNKRCLFPETFQADQEELNAVSKKMKIEN